MPDEIFTASEDEPEEASKVEAGDDVANSREKLIVDIWKQAVDTQKHFNDMCVKSRQLGLTFVAASLGAALYLFIRAPGTGGENGGNGASSVYAYSFNLC